MPLTEDLSKRSTLPTTQDVVQYSTRNGRVVETLKDVFVWELRDFFNTKSKERLDAVPSVDKFSADLSGNNRELDPMETIVRVLRQFPDLTQRLPMVAVTAGSIKSLKIGMSTKLIDQVKAKPCLVSGTGSFPTPVLPPSPGFPFGFPIFIPTPTIPAPQPDPGQPFVPFGAQPPIINQPPLNIKNSDFLEVTIIIDGVTHVSRFVFPDQLIGPPAQSYRIVANAINLQALYCHADVVLKNGVPTLIIEPGGPLGRGTYYSIQRTNASANFDSWINFDTMAHIAPSDEFPAVNRYAMSYTAEMSLVVACDGDTVRTELTDLVMNFFTFLMDDRQFTFYGRSFYGDTEGEAYQIIIKDAEVSCGGEAETPRGDDPVRKVYSNSIVVPVHIMYYIDRAVAEGANFVRDDTLPGLN